MKIDPAGHYRLAARRQWKVPIDYAVSLFRYSPQQARSSQIDALPNGGLLVATTFRAAHGRRSPNKRDIRAASRRIFEDTMQRCKHPRLKVSALFCVLDIQMNAGDLVSRQVRLEDIHALLGSPQRGSPMSRTSAITNGAPQLARSMADADAPQYQTGQASKLVRNRRDVEIASDSKLLGRSQRRNP